MIVSLHSSGGPTLLESENLRALEVRTAAGTLPAAIAKQLGALGTMDATHAWLLIDELKALGPAEAEWGSGFDAMIAYAQRAGWVSGDPRRVRAHLTSEA